MPRSKGDICLECGLGNGRVIDLALKLSPQGIG